MLNKAQTPLRILFGIFWLIFGLNFFFHYLPQPPMNEAAGQLLGALYQSGLLKIVKIVEVAVGLMLVANILALLALVIIAPIVINILFVHTALDSGGLPVAVVALALNLVLAASYKNKYTELLKIR